ncbi:MULTISPECIES: DUF6290 family protein [unclassified Actinomyces]|uniref:DUF6290 family protein n=1 Tax=unclassified Actinomyces TaxID=2609248 RepID=UPI00201754AC|nr:MULTISPECIES: DUF6290 family protein [unclassified Actinomyces]MCL3777523.1 ribbon-helix-helix protein, CopG family [Actinomyces sp. AC-20-1]MCL3790335.1 ribbon-helix-helix protein, CopG family [Actinomyces sp. 187325]MCL3792612.1 ribbon-helix-helix protein, CopG family [Actinomyces sp. 186855]MCL3795111.1 ribbon-helix-helix protein, CopG family [Actinomyces sp. 217892]
MTAETVAALARESERALETERFMAEDSPLPAHVVVTHGSARTQTLQVRMNDDELERLRQAAQRRGTTLSAFARTILLSALEEGTDARALLRRVRADLDVLESVVVE